MLRTFERVDCIQKLLTDDSYMLSYSLNLMLSYSLNL